jgi:ABC-type lipoprotein export system ATPase subunit
MATHSPNIVASADRVITMLDGRIKKGQGVNGPQVEQSPAQPVGC